MTAFALRQPAPMPAVVWHYTAESEKLASILRDGLLCPLAPGIGEREEPITWFSAHPKYEPSAIKMLCGPSGTVRPMTLAEQIERFGCARIGIDRAGAIPWARLVIVTKSSPTTQRALIRSVEVLRCGQRRGESVAESTEETLARDFLSERRLCPNFPARAVAPRREP